MHIIKSFIKFIDKYIIALLCACVSVPILIIFLSNKYLHLSELPKNLSFDGDDMLVGMLSLQIGFVAFVSPLIFNIVYNLSEKFRPYHKLYIDSLLKHTNFKENLISGCLCIGFILFGIWGYTYTPSSNITHNNLLWRLFFEICTGIWSLTNIYCYIRSIFEVIKKTKDEVNDKDFLADLHKIIDYFNKLQKLKGNNDYYFEKPSDLNLTIGDRNNIFKLILKKTSKYDHKEFFINFVNFRFDRKNTIQLIKIVQSLLFFFIEDYKDLSKDTDTIKKKLHYLFRRLDEIFNFYLYNKNWEQYQECIDAIIYSYEEALNAKANLIADYCREFLIYHFTGQDQIIDDFHRSHISQDHFVYNYLNYETPLKTYERSNYNKTKFFLYYYDVYVSLIVTFTYLEKYLGEDLKLLKYQRKKRSNKTTTIFNQFGFYEHYLPSILRRYFLICQTNPLIIPADGWTQFNSLIDKNHYSRHDYDIIPNRNIEAETTIPNEKYFSYELKILDQYAPDIFLKLKDEIYRETLISELIAEYQRSEERDSYLNSFIYKATQLAKLCENEQQENFRIFLEELATKAKDIQRDLEDQEVEKPEIRDTYKKSVVQKIEKGIIQSLQDMYAVIYFVFAKDNTKISPLNHLGEQFTYSFPATKQMIIDQHVHDFTDHILDIYAFKTLFPVFKSQKNKTIKENIDDILKYIENIKRPDDYLILTDVYLNMPIRKLYQQDHVEVYTGHAQARKLHNIPIREATYTPRNFRFSEDDYKHYLMIIPKNLFKEFTIDGKDVPYIDIADAKDQNFNKTFNIKFRYKIDLDFKTYGDQIKTFIFDDYLYFEEER